MNEDDMEDFGPHAGDELERRLARYARVRLEPSPAQVRRARAAVMEEASRQLPAEGPHSARRVPFWRSSTRRLTASLAAAVLIGLVLGTSVFAASRAGGPLYEARLVLESLGTPSDPDARVAAEVAHAQSRLAEAMEASAHHDQRALEAALIAYEAAIDRLEAATGPSAERALEAIRFHRAVLLDVLASAPAGAASGLTRAISESDRLIERFETSGTGRPGDPGAGGGSSGSGPAGTDRTAKPDDPTTPERTARPERTSRPEATKRPDRSPHPGGPTSTDDPGNRGQPTERP